MKRKLFLFAIAALSVCVMAACGKKGSSKDNDEKDDTELVEDEDEEQTEADEQLADGVTAAPDEDWTEEAVANMLRKAYKDVNVIYGPREDDLEPNLDLYAMYCTEGFNELLNKIRTIDAENDYPGGCYSCGIDYAWNYWGEGKVEPKNIQVQLLTGDMAEATFELTHGEEWMQTKVGLYYENGEWRINDWLQVGDDDESKVERMALYIQNNS